MVMYGMSIVRNQSGTRRSYDILSFVRVNSSAARGDRSPKSRIASRLQRGGICHCRVNGNS